MARLFWPYCSMELEWSFETLVHSRLWRMVLMCFDVEEAIACDRSYGFHHKEWFLTERLSSSSFCPDMWMDCLKYQMWNHAYLLLEAKVSCPDLDYMIQKSTDHEMLCMLILLTDSQAVFYNSDRKVIRTTYVPTLDAAIENHDLRVVRYVLWRYGPHKRLFKHPVQALQTIVTKRNVALLHLLVPHVLKVTTIAPVLTAIEERSFDMARELLRLLDANLFVTIPEKVSISAAKAGDLPFFSDVFQQCGDVSETCFQTAFSNGHIGIVSFLADRHVDWRPDEESILKACEDGCLEVLQWMDDSTTIPPTSMENAIRSKNARVLLEIYNRVPDFKFTGRHMEMAIRGGSEEMVMVLFTIGKFKEFTKNATMELIQKRMVHALQCLAECGVIRYTEETLCEAAKVCDLQMVKDMMAVVRPTRETLNRAFKYAFVSVGSQRQDVCNALNSAMEQK